jgi:hypothetical protein
MAREADPVKKIVFLPLTVSGAALECLQRFWAVLSPNGSQEPPRKEKEPLRVSQNKSPPRGTSRPADWDYYNDRPFRPAVVAASLLTPTPPDPSPQVRLYAEALAALATAPPGELVLIATIPPGTVLTTALLETLDLKVVHRDQLADIVGWGFVRVEPHG